MHILLTGHRGFIGRTLFEHLSKEHTVLGLDIKDGQDLQTCDFPKTVDLIIHLAGRSGTRDSIKNPGLYWNNNVEAARRLFDFYKGTRIIYASSSSAYEPSRNPYAASKLALEDLASQYPNTLGLRLHTVYSSKPREGMFFDKLLSKTLDHTTPHTRDFIHLDDVITAFDLIINSDLAGVIDVGTGTAVSIQDMSPSVPCRLNTPHERQHTLANIKELTKLGFKPKYSIKEFLTINNLYNKL